MPNSDSTFGTFNKQTKIIAQIDDGSTTLTEFADVAAAKSFFFTDDALTCMDETCTVLLWALENDGNGKKTRLKTTFAFGTKGNSDIAEADDWAAQYNTRQTALRNANNWTKPTSQDITITDSSSHLG